MYFQSYTCNVKLHAMYFILFTTESEMVLLCFTKTKHWSLMAAVTVKTHSIHLPKILLWNLFSSNSNLSI